MQFAAFAFCLATGSSFTSFFFFSSPHLRQHGDSSRPRRLRSLCFKLLLLNLDPPQAAGLSLSPRFFFNSKEGKEVPQLWTFPRRHRRWLSRFLPSRFSFCNNVTTKRKLSETAENVCQWLRVYSVFPDCAACFSFFFPLVYLETLSLW